MASRTYSARLSSVMCEYLELSWMSWPLALGTVKGRVMASNSSDVASLSRMYIRPGMKSLSTCRRDGKQSGNVRANLFSEFVLKNIYIFFPLFECEAHRVNSCFVQMLNLPDLNFVISRGQSMWTRVCVRARVRTRRRGRKKEGSSWLQREATSALLPRRRPETD